MFLKLFAISSTLNDYIEALSFDSSIALYQTIVIVWIEIIATLCYLQTVIGGGFTKHQVNLD